MSQSGAEVARLENHIYPVSALAWAGTWIASGDWSGVVRLWDTTGWSEYRVLPVQGAIRRLSFGDTTLSAQTDDALVTWNIANGALISQASRR